MIFGYMRISTEDKQDFSRQEYILKNSGYEIDPHNIFCDRKSGKDLNREQYQLMRKFVRAGDIIVFPELSRFSRNYNEISTEMQFFKDKGVKLIFLDMPFLNSSDDLINQLICDICIKLFAFVAQIERENTRKRIKQKLDEMKASGVKLGRPDIVLNDEQMEIMMTYLLKKEGYTTAKEAAKKCGLKYDTFCKMASRIRKEQNIPRIIKRPDLERD